ncbi:hypothetical protein FB446DRAFT_708483 [Lentinula raphanica]|nr:hypothetical protein FB446DRAFT_708483 [Lentinula raphanica]
MHKQYKETTETNHKRYYAHGTRTRLREVNQSEGNPNTRAQAKSVESGVWKGGPAQRRGIEAFLSSPVTKQNTSQKKDKWKKGGLGMMRAEGDNIAMGKSRTENWGDKYDVDTSEPVGIQKKRGRGVVEGVEIQHDGSQESSTRVDDCPNLLPRLRFHGPEKSRMEEVAVEEKGARRRERVDGSKEEEKVWERTEGWRLGVAMPRRQISAS